MQLCEFVDRCCVAPLAPNLRRPGFKLYWVITYAQTLSSSSDSITKCLSMSSCLVVMPVHVVACILSSFVALAYFLASTTLMCACTSPSWRTVVCGAYLFTLLRNRVGYCRVVVSVLVIRSMVLVTRSRITSGVAGGGTSAGTTLALVSPASGNSKVISYTILSSLALMSAGLKPGLLTCGAACKHSIG